ncbi:hypothetical protein HAX54_036249 [Datura stramonium]|uniref:Uncharacterized protein n=1 Tax=Datura stramonium TaxID=4076 RepID=A0ABS8SG61_DATST|nr:hypothetical protein [Datura stramonium]
MKFELQVGTKTINGLCPRVVPLSKKEERLREEGDYRSRRAKLDADKMTSIKAFARKVDEPIGKVKINKSLAKNGDDDAGKGKGMLLFLVELGFDFWPSGQGSVFFPFVRHQAQRVAPLGAPILLARRAGHGTSMPAPCQLLSTRLTNLVWPFFLF